MRTTRPILGRMVSDRERVDHDKDPRYLGRFHEWGRQRASGRTAGRSTGRLKSTSWRPGIHRLARAGW